MSDDLEFCPDCGEKSGKKLESELKESKNKIKSLSNEYVHRNRFGLAGFILALVSFFVNLFFVPGALGLLFSILGVTRRNTCTRWNAFAMIGLILSIISVVLYIFLVAFGVTSALAFF